ncbi:MAG: 4-(cytidine 5'-diphospho)-2-C-methyl-D-erythritol kinase [Chloroflexi bacterium]|nr:4-(cytidine 5'-diphospho)-2-C-methyl-D-erythritol kinase [Chloroflexota bacterium]
MKLSLRACAKLNLTLEVLGKRPDGYHEIASVMQQIDLCDELSLEQAPDLSLECDVPGLQGGDNLVLRAAGRLRDLSGWAHGARITLTKHIPLAAGLGGGSSDAATALLGLNRLWGMDLQKQQLAGIAAGIGSDVPFFLSGISALARGRGEILTPLPGIASTWFVLLKPAIVIEHKTAVLYSRLAREDYSDGARSELLSGLLASRAPVDPGLYCNVFDRALKREYAEVREAWRAFEEAGATTIHACGSGPTLFSPFASEAQARDVQRKLAGREVYLARALS